MPILDYARLEGWAARSKAGYAAAAPFPSIVATDFIDAETVGRACREFPAPEALRDWRKIEIHSQAGEPFQTHKLGWSDPTVLGPTLSGLLYEMNSGRFIKILETLTGIPDLMSDCRMIGAGLHQYLPGAVLAVHADFINHRIFNLRRCLNLLLYLNDPWMPEWGGELELWDAAMTRPVVTVPPAGGTCVVFTTSKQSFHGMPEPLKCPPGQTRKSIALYYYTSSASPSPEPDEHLTLWQTRG